MREVAKGAALIVEGKADNSIYLVVAGRFSVLVKGSRVAVRSPGDHVGEIAAIDPTRRRSATVMADEDSVVLEVAEPALTKIANQYPSIWRAIAVVMASRLVQRNDFVVAVNDIPRVFVMSSAEALPVAREIQAGLAHDDMLVTLWGNGVFVASQYPLESLEDELVKADFAIAVVQPDDIVERRDQKHPVTRDNVILELGFFMGRLGRRRTLLVEPREQKAALPSDLAGLTTLGYRSGRSEDMAALLGPTCTEIAKLVRKLGPRQGNVGE